MRNVFRRLTPLLAALAVILLVALAGFTQRSLFGTPLEPYAYGFFLNRYPLFIPAIVYGAVRIALAAFEPGSRRWPRLVGAPLGLVLFLAACLHPTFGGLVIRPGYMAGSMAFIRSAPLPTAFAVGALASALIYGLSLGLGSALARWRVGFGWRPLVRAGLSFAALWWGALVLGAPAALGLGPGGFPAAPLSAGDALGAGLLTALALGPHALLRPSGRDPERPRPMAKAGTPL